MKYIRRKIIADIAGSPLKQKAVAFALLLKMRTNDASVIRKYSLYKVYQLTGVSYRAARKYIDTLVKMQLGVFKGRDFYICSMSSSSKHRNVDISTFSIDKTKNVFEQIRELLFICIQARKDFIKSILRLRQNPTKGTDIKVLNRLCKKCCDNPFLPYKEYGLSYKAIAKKLGCCVRTAKKCVGMAIRRGWCYKKKHYLRFPATGGFGIDAPGISFLTRDFAYIVLPNTYVLTPYWRQTLHTSAEERACRRM